MIDGFHGFPGAIVAAGDLNIPRAQALLEAVQRHREFRLLEILRLPGKGGDAAVECLIVEMTCDGVPKKNDYGLQYRERLAVAVSPDRDRLPEVHALRRGFPRLAHQNRIAPDAPAHLCLYFEPTAAVLRTWTPESFLRRILWWFEKNARGELHLADQPLDHLFFASKYELVLSWDFDTMQPTSPQWIIARGEERSDGGITYFLLPESRAANARTTASLVELTLPAIVSAAVELDPVTLGQLADTLQARGAELLPPLSQQLRGLVDHTGAPTRADKPFTVVLVHIPLCRHAGGAVESTTHRAFLLTDDPLELGVATGALMKHEGRYFTAAGVLEPEESLAWRDVPVVPVSVLRQSTPALARAQSGFGDPGPQGVMVGVGALGSAMLNLWGRGGWGTWTAIDNDHVKPHNLSRHTAFAAHLGEAKAIVAAGLHQAVWQGASEIKPIVADACDTKNAVVVTTLEGAALVIDASTTLEYPRYASGQSAFPRHASVFITPSANAAVALIEDSTRTRLLRTLEAQYYRALAQTEWGRVHLAENLSAFWSGASCRDISLVLPYARVMGHASTLAERLPALLATDEATIRIWQYSDDDRGGLTAHEVPVEEERHLVLDGFKVFWDAGLELELRELRRQHLPRETGGVLLGYYDFNVQALVLVMALPAPPDSKASSGAFERGIEGLKATVMEVARRTAGIVGYVGEWHSHPPGHSAAPSTDDWIQLVHLALGMDDDGLPGMQLIVGETDLQVLTAARGRTQ